MGKLASTMAVRTTRVVEGTECRQCCAFCDKLVEPRRCIEMDCPFLYAYENESTGRQYMGCLQKVFSVEIDVEMFRAAERTRHRIRRHQGRARAAGDVPDEGRALLRRRRARVRVLEPDASSTPATATRADTGRSTCAPACPRLELALTREEALAECLRLTREAPDRDTYEYIPRELEEGGWQVVKVALPEGIKKPSETGTATKPPPDAPPPGEDSDDRAPSHLGRRLDAERPIAQLLRERDLLLVRPLLLRARHLQQHRQLLEALVGEEVDDAVLADLARRRGSRGGRGSSRAASSSR